MLRYSLHAHRHFAAAVFRRFAAALPEHRQLTMPKVSPTMTHGRLVEWKKAEGDPISEGDTLAEVETDKATMPIEAKDEGFLARILVRNDTPDIPLGRPIAITVEEKEFVSAFADYKPENEVSEEGQPEKMPSSRGEKDETQPEKPQTSKKESRPSAANEVRKYEGPVGPAVARLLNEFPDISLDHVKGTGPGGRILKGDLLAAVVDGSAFGRSVAPSVQKQALTKTSDASVDGGKEHRLYTDIPLTSMRRAIARRLSESKRSVPHRYASVNYELDAVLSLRKQLNSADSSLAVSVNDFIIQAVAVCLRRVPEMNVRYDESTGGSQSNGSVDVAFAVAVENGLITPIVKRADCIGLKGIAVETKRLVGLARSGSLQPEDYEGGSFSISNLGMYGITSFSAIINPPQSGILAVGSGVPHVLVDTDSGKTRQAIVGTGTLSTDARIVGEDTAAKFLKEFSDCLSQPHTMLL